MKRYSLNAAAAAVMAVLFTSFGPAVAAAQKSGGKVQKLGDNAADLGSDILGPVLLFVAGAMAVVAMVKREVALIVSAVAFAFIAGFFIFTPTQAESVVKGIINAIT